jgi:hypothetical protein
VPWHYNNSNNSNNNSDNNAMMLSIPTFSITTRDKALKKRHSVQLKSFAEYRYAEGRGVATTSATATTTATTTTTTTRDHLYRNEQNKMKIFCQRLTI